MNRRDAPPADPWPPQAVLQFLTTDQRISRAPRDPDYARGQLEAVADGECFHALIAGARGDWQKANTETYDAARKAVEMLLLSVGWRVKSSGGGHQAVVDIVQRWLGSQPPPGPRIAQKYGASVKARHDHEYPHPRNFPRTARELRELTLDNVRLVNLVRTQLGMPVRGDLLPTDDNLEPFRNLPAPELGGR